MLTRDRSGLSTVESGDDSNHRYTTSAAIKADMLAAGYIAEGYGPDGVVMCAVQ
jgi:hypothetical protein